MSELERLGSEAKEAARLLAYADSETKNAALCAIADALLEHAAPILEANARDVAQARENGTSTAMLDRLALTPERLTAIANAVRKVERLPDPIGEVTERWTLHNGLAVERVRVPLGVIGIIYEARPNVTVDAAVLCLKAGSAAFLRGGKETIHSNIALEAVMRGALRKAGLPEACITVLHDTSRETAAAFMRLRGLIDVLIPRGGAGLIRAVIEQASVPVIETGSGNCHVFVDQSADLAMATSIIVNAKAQRPSVCNAAETLLVHAGIAPEFLPQAAQALRGAGVELRGCAQARALVPDMAEATETDWETEYNDYILAVRVVDDLDAALDHIRRYSTHHSESIATRDDANAARFLREVDSAAVYHNASTRFTDGEEFGFGAEIGISTQKMHARGPMGLREICSYKYLVHGTGQTR
ncbi:MAG: glutamate-5-semialdehyde dehydrogenase [Clostridium sp. SCN 57-10]|nr:MAG: glutamate-5-semialdehyde dehydrogenase [Clostridium sp. SCN 57-10]